METPTAFANFDGNWEKLLQILTPVVPHGSLGEDPFNITEAAHRFWRHPNPGVQQPHLSCVIEMQHGSALAFTYLQI